MNRHLHLTERRCPKQAGFALIASLSIMAVLVMISVALYSMSSVATRSAELATARTVAQANAKMALTMAIGELQKNTGLDTRVTAPADILDAANPQLVGVWRSWEGLDHETSGDLAGRPRPMSALYPLKESSGHNARFINWLVSGASDDVSNLNEAGNLVRSTPDSQTVPMLSTGTLGDDDDPADGNQIHLIPRDLDDKGKYAWWVSGENQKALLPRVLDEGADNYPSTVAEWSDVVKTNSTADPAPFGLDSLFDEPSVVDKTVNRETMALLDSDDPEFRTYFHDLSPYSVGLLTNVATGGWKKDLSLFSERNDHDELDLPLFQVTPTETIEYDWPTTGSPTPETSLLYPWSDYLNLGDSAAQKIGAVSSWANMLHWATHYKRAVDEGDGVYSTPNIYPNLNTTETAGIYDFLHLSRMSPLLARIQFLFSLSSTLDPEPPEDAEGDQYYPRLLITPIITLWNPYNVSVTLPDNYSMFVNEPLPVALKFGFDDTWNDTFQPVMQQWGGGSQYGTRMKGSELRGSSNSTPYVARNGLFIIRINLAGPHDFAPGEALVFSPPAGFNNIFANAQPVFTPGIRLDVGWNLGITDTGDPEDWKSLPGSTEIGVQAVFDNLNVTGGSGIIIDSFTDGTSNRVARNHNVFSEEVAGDLNPPLEESDLSDMTLSSASSGPLPFLSLIYGPRISSSSSQFASKGFVQGNPLTQNIVSEFTVTEAEYLNHDYNGADHPVNIHYDFSAIPHSPIGDSEFANIEGQNGFIMSGRTAPDGLTRAIIANLPIRPIASLVELTNWDMRLENPVPPFAFNIIGNSDASPLIASDSVIGADIPNDAENLQHDDSYCANHLLFDDWFVSSIAPDPTSSNSRDLAEVYEDFLLGAEPLPNRAYKALPEDRASAAAGNISTLYSSEVDDEEAWQTIASRLEVEGMFNVNSTSVAAWQALLGHARNIRIPYFDAEESVGLSSKTDYAFSRFPVAADTAAGDNGISSSEVAPFDTEWMGYRVLDAAFIESLAQEIVGQVRARGPFLSLAEFVNRQLDSPESDLTLAGAIQTALNEVASSNNTFNELAAFSGVSSSDPEGEEGYQYDNAAEGSAAYGVPGWTRQADVLRPIAPILSARDDTFTLRAYGDVRDTSGTITARAYCEAVVRRTREYVAPSATDTADSTNAPVSPTNSAFGRRFEIVSFRWLDPDEV